MKHLLDLKTTMAILPFGYKASANVTLTLTPSQKNKLWQLLLQTAQQHVHSTQQNISGYQNAPLWGTLLRATWTNQQEELSASVVTSMISSTPQTLLFEGKWLLNGISDVKDTPVPESIFFGLEFFSPRRKFIFGVIPTMTEQLLITVTGNKCAVTLLGRALFEPKLQNIEAHPIYNLIGEINSQNKQ